MTQIQTAIVELLGLAATIAALFVGALPVKILVGAGIVCDLLIVWSGASPEKSELSRLRELEQEVARGLVRQKRGGEPIGFKVIKKPDDSYEVEVHG